MAKLAKVAALTAAYGRPDLLRKWIDHNAAQFGLENLYVLSQGPRDMHAPLLEHVNSVHLPRAFDTDFDTIKGQWFSHQSAVLSTVYQCIVVTDMDELLCLAPDHPGTLSQYLLKGGPQTRAPLFFNLVPHDSNTTIDWNAPVLSQVKAMQFASHLCNPMVLYHPVTFFGRHAIRNSDFHVDTALHTYHLKYLATDTVGAYYDTIGAEVRDIFSERGEEVSTLKGWSRGRNRLDRWIAAQSSEPVHPFEDLKPTIKGLFGVQKQPQPNGFLSKPIPSDETPLFEIPKAYRTRY